MAGSIGTVAGVVWHYLNYNGASSVTKITKETAADAKSIQRAIGWLAGEEKLAFVMKGRTEMISLR